MPIRIVHDDTSALQRGAEGAAQQLAFERDQLARRRDEQERLRLADRDFEFRQQQADRGQANNDRSFDQRQGVIDHGRRQEKAAGDFFMERLRELDPNISPIIDSSGMSPNMLRQIYDAELYDRQLTEARSGAESVWQQVLTSDLGIEDGQDPAVQQVGEMIRGAATIEELGEAKQLAYRVLQNAHQQRLEMERRSEIIAMTQPMRVGLQGKPEQMASASVLDRMLQNGDIDPQEHWRRLGELVLDGDSGGGKRPTTERLAFSRGLDPTVTEFAETGDKVEYVNRVRRLMAATGQPAPEGFEEIAAEVDAERRQANRAKLNAIQDPDARTQRAYEMALEQEPDADEGRLMQLIRGFFSDES